MREEKVTRVPLPTASIRNPASNAQQLKYSVPLSPNRRIVGATMMAYNGTYENNHYWNQKRRIQVHVWMALTVFLKCKWTLTV